MSRAAARTLFLLNHFINWPLHHSASVWLLLSLIGESSSHVGSIRLLPESFFFFSISAVLIRLSWCMDQKNAVSVLIDEDSVAEESVTVRGVLQRKIPFPVDGHPPVNITSVAFNALYEPMLTWSVFICLFWLNHFPSSWFVYLSFRYWFSEWLCSLQTVGMNFRERERGSGICVGNDDGTICWRWRMVLSTELYI